MVKVALIVAAAVLFIVGLQIYYSPWQTCLREYRHVTGQLTPERVCIGLMYR